MDIQNAGATSKFWCSGRNFYSLGQSLAQAGKCTFYGHHCIYYLKCKLVNMHWRLAFFLQNVVHKFWTVFLFKNMAVLLWSVFFVQKHEFVLLIHILVSELVSEICVPLQKSELDSETHVLFQKCEVGCEVNVLLEKCEIKVLLCVLMQAYDFGNLSYAFCLLQEKQAFVIHTVDEPCKLVF